jgi:hypothetical protein
LLLAVRAIDREKLGGDDIPAVLKRDDGVLKPEA